MNRAETATFLLLMREYYPKESTASSIDTKVTAWELILKDLSFQAAVEALLALVANDTKGFPPVPGQIIAASNRITEQGNELTELEAWDIVRKAVSNSGYEAAKEFDMLPDILRSIVHSPSQLRDWSMMDENTVNSVIQSNFLRAFRAKRESYQYWANVPSGVRALASSVTLGELPGGKHMADPLELANKREETRRLLEKYGRGQNLSE